MLRMFQFINHGGRIILYRNMTVPHNVHNHVILSQTITSRTYSRSHIRCRREKHPVHFFLFRQVNPEKPDVPLNKNDAFQKVQKRRVQEKR